MTIAEMLGQSGTLTLLGMGIVFGFLVVMIVCITLAGKVVHALGADRDLLPRPAKAAGNVSGAGSDNAAVTAAISAAVNEYQKSGKR
jgi:oxaloacetate decarboxylase gamma subunit